MTSKIGEANQVEPGSTSLEVQKARAGRVEKVEDVLKPKQKLDVKVIDINDRNQIKLSRKALIKLSLIHI